MSKKDCSKRYYEKYKKKLLAKSRSQWRKNKYTALTHYSKPFTKPTCLCCYETNIEFLTIDHRDISGSKHRQEDPKAHKIYRWLKTNNYPEGFQTLCLNCNFSFGHTGYCPYMWQEVGSWHRAW